MSEPAAARCPVERIEVRIQVGDSLLAASDDPLFLGLRGPSGREFRLLLAHGKSLRRKADDHFRLGGPDANVAQPALNDPASPPIDAEEISGAYLRKGLDPIPNVRAVAEMDDRLELTEVEVTLHYPGGLLRFGRQGPLWLGLVTGMQIELARLDAA